MLFKIKNKKQRKKSIQVHITTIGTVIKITAKMLKTRLLYVGDGVVKVGHGTYQLENGVQKLEQRTSLHPIFFYLIGLITMPQLVFFFS